MSGEYISREAAINRLNENWRRTNTGSIAEACYSAAIDSIHLIPAADVVEVRHGHWIEDGDVQICSECGEEHEWVDYRAPYCDTCGAKMDGGHDDGTA